MINKILVFIGNIIFKLRYWVGFGGMRPSQFVVSFRFYFISD